MEGPSRKAWARAAEAERAGGSREVGQGSPKGKALPSGSPQGQQWGRAPGTEVPLRKAQPLHPTPRPSGTQRKPPSQPGGTSPFSALRFREAAGRRGSELLPPPLPAMRPGSPRLAETLGGSRGAPASGSTPVRCSLNRGAGGLPAGVEERTQLTHRQVVPSAGFRLRPTWETLLLHHSLGLESRAQPPATQTGTEGRTPDTAVSPAPRQPRLPRGPLRGRETSTLRGTV